MSSKLPAILVLADGTKFRGTSIGIKGSVVGEVVFNTSMTGYQEILTDSSYTEQIITFTYPHIGNTGVNLEDLESEKVRAKGLIIRDLSIIHSNFRATMSLSEYLKGQKIVGISEIDTRALTQHLRINGSQSGCIMAGTIDEKEAVKKAQSFIGITGMDLASVVSTKKKYIAKDGEWMLGEGYQKIPKPKYHVVAYDFGIKRNILRMLNSRNCKITVVPAKFSAKDVLALKPDGVFLSNGPGDPEPCDYAITSIKKLLEKNVPIFGICLGHQLLSIASGAKTEKMKFGHHGANHPVQDLKSKKVMITSQNHGFAVSEENIPDNIEITHRSLFDKSIQGIKVKNKPAFSFQGHPEASPGPHDVSYLFDEFIDLMSK
mgnify:CR=1 FL=1